MIVGKMSLYLFCFGIKFKNNTQLMKSIFDFENLTDIIFHINPASTLREIMLTLR